MVTRLASQRRPHRLAYPPGWGGVLPFLIVLLSCLLWAPANAKQLVKRLPYHWVNAQAPLTVLYVPAVEEIYIETERQDGRYTKFQLVGAENLVKVVGDSGLGSWRGFSFVKSAFDKYLPFGAGVIAAAAVTGEATDRMRRGSAEQRVFDFRQALNPAHGHRQMVDALRSALVANDNLGFASAQIVTLAGPADLASGDVSDVQQRLRDGQIPAEMLANNGRVLIVASVAVLPPGLETVEINVVFGMLDPARSVQDEPRAIYQNAIVVQSRLVTGLDGSDRRDEVKTLLDQARDDALRNLPEAGRRPKERSTARRKILNRHKKAIARIGHSYQNYSPIPSDPLWLENPDELNRQLAEGYVESVRLRVAELNGETSLRGSRMAFPPAAPQQLPQLINLQNERRDVYRLPRGQLLSLDRMSRLIPLNHLNE